MGYLKSFRYLESYETKHSVLLLQNVHVYIMYSNIPSTMDCILTFSSSPTLTNLAGEKRKSYFLCVQKAEIVLCIKFRIGKKRRKPHDPRPHHLLCRPDSRCIMSSVVYIVLSTLRIGKKRRKPHDPRPHHLLCRPDSRCIMSSLQCILSSV